MCKHGFSVLIISGYLKSTHRQPIVLITTLKNGCWRASPQYHLIKWMYSVEEIELTSPDKTGSYSNGKAGLFHPARQSDLGHKHSTTYFAQLIGITVIKL